MANKKTTTTPKRNAPAPTKNASSRKAAAPAPKEIQSAPAASGSVTHAVTAASTAAPTLHAPATPPDYRPLSGTDVRRYKKPLFDQVTSANSVANEIDGSPTYAADFGARALAPGPFAAGLRVAAAWSQEAAQARAWATFADNCASAAWNTTLTSFDTFKLDFKAAVSHDPTIPRRYPELAGFIAARGTIAQRANQTRKKDKASKPPTG